MRLDETAVLTGATSNEGIVECWHVLFVARQKTTECGLFPTPFVLYV